jgi:hypothetical protein
MLRRRLFASLILAVGLHACAVGPTLQEAALPPADGDQARIFVYRAKDGDGWAMQPDISIDEVVLGQATRGGILYRDVPAGRHCTAIDRPWLAPLINYYGTPFCDELKAGEERYFRVDWTTFLNYFLVSPTHEARLVQVAPDVAKAELNGLVVVNPKK